MHITKHGYNRIRRRLGLNKKSIEKNIAQALLKGISYDTATGKLKKYIASEYEKRKTANNIRIYSRYVYIFEDTKLITVFPLMHEYHHLEDKIKTKWKK